MNSKKLTSITNAKINNFINDPQKKYRSELSCEFIKGFHLRKLKKSLTWRFRYTNHSGDQTIISLGKFIRGNHNEMAVKALENCTLVLNGKDPKNEIRKNREESQKQTNHCQELTKLGEFYEQIYSPHKLKSKSGKLSLSIIKSNFSHLFNNDMDKLTVDMIRDWELQRLEAGIKRSTLVRDLGTLKAMLNYAAGKKAGDPIDHPVIEVNPISNIQISKPTFQQIEEQEQLRRNTRRILDTTELQYLYTGLRKYNEALKQKRKNSIYHGKKHLKSLNGVTFAHWSIPFTLLALHTGLRPSDIYGCTWEKNYNYIDFNLGKIFIVPEKTRGNGLSAANIELPLSPELEDILNKWWRQSSMPTSGQVFPSRSGERLAKKSHNRHWNNIKKLGGLDESIDFYCLRHNFISTLVSKNIPLLHIAKLVGHKSTEMIERNYGHLSPSSAINAIKLHTSTLNGFEDE